MVQSGLERALRACLPAVLAVILPSAASAQDAQQPAAANASWIKICGQEPNTQKQLCQIVRQITADTGQFIASVNLQTLEGEDKKVLAAAMTLPASGVRVELGMRAQIDDGEQYELKYSICFPAVCYADMQVDDTFVSAMKAGGQITLIAATQGTTAKDAQQVKPLPIPVSLVGFTAAYDGEGIDPAAAQAVREDLAKSLKEHADEARQKLLEQQQQVNQ